MKFSEVLDSFRNHSYIRRLSWSKNVFVNYRQNVPLIRMVMITPGENFTIKVLDNDIKLTADDIFADDWVEIDNC